MAQQERMSGTAREKRNCWMRGNGSYSYRGELKRGEFIEQEIPETESAPQRRHYPQRKWLPKNMPDDQYGKLYLKSSHAFSFMECMVFFIEETI